MGANGRFQRRGADLTRVLIARCRQKHTCQVDARTLSNINSSPCVGRVDVRPGSLRRHDEPCRSRLSAALPRLGPATRALRTLVSLLTLERRSPAATERHRRERRGGGGGARSTGGGGGDSGGRRRIGGAPAAPAARAAALAAAAAAAARLAARSPAAATRPAPWTPAPATGGSRPARRSDRPTLKTAAAQTGRLIGAALAPRTCPSPPTRGPPPPSFNSATPENEMKWDATEPTAERFTFDRGDAIVAFAAQNGMQVKGHTLVWHSQLPSWVSAIQDTTDMRDAMINHITQVALHFRGKVIAWDVVNEAVADSGHVAAQHAVLAMDRRALHRRRLHRRPRRRPGRAPLLQRLRRRRAGARSRTPSTTW